jgi:hypothetical protein
VREREEGWKGREERLMNMGRRWRRKQVKKQKRDRMTQNTEGDVRSLINGSWKG